MGNQKESKLNWDELTRILDFNPKTGVFRWKMPKVRKLAEIKYGYHPNHGRKAA